MKRNINEWKKDKICENRDQVGWYVRKQQTIDHIISTHNFLRPLGE